MKLASVSLPTGRLQYQTGESSKKLFKGRCHRRSTFGFNFERYFSNDRTGHKDFIVVASTTYITVLPADTSFTFIWVHPCKKQSGILTIRSEPAGVIQTRSPNSSWIEVTNYSEKNMCLVIVAEMMTEISLSNLLGSLRSQIFPVFLLGFEYYVLFDRIHLADSFLLYITTVEQNVSVRIEMKTFDDNLYTEIKEATLSRLDTYVVLKYFDFSGSRVLADQLIAVSTVVTNRNKMIMQMPPRKTLNTRFILLPYYTDSISTTHVRIITVSNDTRIYNLPDNTRLCVSRGHVIDFQTKFEWKKDVTWFESNKALLVYQSEETGLMTSFILPPVQQFETYFQDMDYISNPIDFRCTFASEEGIASNFTVEFVDTTTKTTEPIVLSSIGYKGTNGISVRSFHLNNTPNGYDYFTISSNVNFSGLCLAVYNTGTVTYNPEHRTDRRPFNQECRLVMQTRECNGCNRTYTEDCESEGNSTQTCNEYTTSVSTPTPVIVTTTVVIVTCVCVVSTLSVWKFLKNKPKQRIVPTRPR